MLYFAQVSEALVIQNVSNPGLTHVLGAASFGSRLPGGLLTRLFSLCCSLVLLVLRMQGHDIAEFDNPTFDTGNHAFGTMIRRSITWLAAADDDGP